MFGGVFGANEEATGTENAKLKKATGTIIDGFGAKDERRPKNGAISAVEGLEEAGRKAGHRRSHARRAMEAEEAARSDAEEVDELMSLFGRKETGKPAWDSTPFRPRPAALQGILPVTRELWAADEDVYNRKFETRDVGVPDRYLDRTARGKQHQMLVLDRAYNAFDRRFDEIANAQANKSGTRIDTLGGEHRPTRPRAAPAAAKRGSARNKAPAAKPKRSARAAAPVSPPASKAAPSSSPQQYTWPHNRNSWLPAEQFVKR